MKEIIRQGNYLHGLQHYYKRGVEGNVAEGKSGLRQKDLAGRVIGTPERYQNLFVLWTWGKSIFTPKGSISN